jgi:hypothetical protein
MKYRNFILSVLFWAIASVCLAITLPSSSYIGSTVDVDYSFSTANVTSGRSITGTYLASSVSYDGACNDYKQVSNERRICCMGQLTEVFSLTLTQCVQQNNTDCMSYWETCLNATSLPLGSPLLLLPFALIYAVVRRRNSSAVSE